MLKHVNNEEKKSRYTIIVYYFVYAAQIICNVIGVLRTIAFMELKRNCPLNHDRVCRFFFGHISPTLLPVLLVSSLSRSLDLSNLTDGSQAYPEETRRVGAISACSNARQTICLSRGTGRSGRNSEEGFFCALLSKNEPPFDTLRRAET